MCQSRSRARNKRNKLRVGGHEGNGTEDGKGVVNSFSTARILSWKEKGGNKREADEAFIKERCIIRD